ncbi:hypothetical protein [Alicyclobacillus acidocaldarius]|uniref:Uncharacterized protein n=1 Tax=Alicyclobacillus acidocaldarius (strain Tc-4-1) TaxID=1048834 RepID=F8IL87_ALIAT|nr:hypothetical protein [Alicyclobacillus acidocaldarius]AEJ43653.1 hypothetical protein TC41_1726 [Alicyclobacillus acidocaldarius subsp. acidocaldarius Tc-4-1]
MKVYLALGDTAAEAWIHSTLPGVEWVETPDGADLALVTQLAHAKAALQAKVPVKLVAGTQQIAKKARQLGLPDDRIMVVPVLNRLTASQVLAFLVRDLDSPPVRYTPAPFKVQVVSSRQAGGTFLAWNLFHVLVSRGVKAKLVSVSNASPLATWISPPYRDMVFGTTEADGGEVWVIDTSDTTTEVPDADAVILVQDCDPAKALPVVKDETYWLVVNRVPYGLEVGSEAHMVIPDFGAAAYEAMTTGVPVAAKHAAFASGLWELWLAIDQYEHNIRLDVTVNEGDGDESAEEQQGFVMDDDAGDDEDHRPEFSGFVLDE